jgi:hypothetical protein
MGIQVVSTTTASTTSVVRLRATVAVSDVMASATYEIPASQIEYIDLSVGVVLDTVGRFKLLADFVGVADAVSKSFTKGLTDAATATASQPILEPRKGISDAIALSDELTRTLVFLRNFADTATVAETSSFQFTRGVEREFLLALDAEKIDFTKVITDGFAMNDSADVGDGSTYFFAKAISNVAFVADASTRSVSKGLTDSATVADATALTPTKGLFDIATTGEVTFFAVTKALADLVTTLDVTQAAVDKQLADTATVADATALSVDRPLADDAQAVDAVSTAAEKGLFESVGLFDAQSFATAKALADLVTVPDAPALSVSRPLADGASVGDNSFLQFSATRVESTLVADEGFLFAQNYCDVTYFASDYVGVSQSF